MAEEKKNETSESNPDPLMDFLWADDEPDSAPAEQPVVPSVRQNSAVPEPETPLNIDEGAEENEVPSAPESLSQTDAVPEVVPEGPVTNVSSEAVPVFDEVTVPEMTAEAEPVSDAEPLPEELLPQTPEKKEQPKKKSAAGSLVEVVEIFVGAFIAAILVLTLLCRTGVVKGTSMVPTMYEGDRYLISDLFYTPKQGDIVVFRPGIDGENDMWIKRVIATEGQKVYIDPNTYQVFVDDRLLEEPYLTGNITIPHTTQNPVTVPEGCVFVMGDNRSVSHDSRYSDLGCVQVGQLAGHVLFRFWPFDRIGICS